MTEDNETTPTKNEKAVQWAELARRCRRAIGPDREIDAAIFQLTCGGLFWPEHNAFFDRDRHGDATPKAFTTKQEIIASLICRELPKTSVSAKWNASHGLTWLAIEGVFQKDEAAAALALCHAFCLAMADAAEHDAKTEASVSQDNVLIWSHDNQAFVSKNGQDYDPFMIGATVYSRADAENIVTEIGPDYEILSMDLPAPTENSVHAYIIAKAQEVGEAETR